MIVLAKSYGSVLEVVRIQVAPELTTGFLRDILASITILQSQSASKPGRIDSVSDQRPDEVMTIADLICSEDDSLLPINLLDGPSAAEILLSSNLRHEWRGFSFGNFWFGYYFGVSQPSPLAEERWAV